MLASDWIYTGINIGSFEGAVMSGMSASNALTGVPTLDDIVGYNFGRLSAAGTKAAVTDELGHWALRTRRAARRTHWP